MTPLAEAAIALARSQLGVTEHPAGSNRGPEVDGYLRAVGIDPTKGTPKDREWCAAFVSAMVARAAAALDCPKRFRGSASCHHLVELNPGLLIDAPEAGCVFVHFTDDGVHGHAGLVTRVLVDSVETIEGNSDAHGSRTGGSVVEQVRPLSYVARWLRVA